MNKNNDLQVRNVCMTSRNQCHMKGNKKTKWIITNISQESMSHSYENRWNGLPVIYWWGHHDCEMTRNQWITSSFYKEPMAHSWENKALARPQKEQKKPTACLLSNTISQSLPRLTYIGIWNITKQKTWVCWHTKQINGCHWCATKWTYSLA